MSRKGRQRNQKSNRQSQISKDVWYLIDEPEKQMLPYKKKVKEEPFHHTQQIKQTKKVHITPRTPNQREYVANLENPKMYITFGIGPAGTGKTMLASQVAVKGLLDGTYDKIIITRPVIPVDDEGIGFLPGSLESKMNPILMPITDVLREYFTPVEIKDMIKSEIIEIAPLAFIRGRTFKKSFIILDEAQGTSPNSLLAFMTRLGDDSKMAITGDVNQSDRGKNNGLTDFINRFERKTDLIYSIAITNFDKSDIQRHAVLEHVLKLYDQD